EEIGTSTALCTSSQSSGNVTTQRPRRTSSGDAPRARPTERSVAASSATSPASSTAPSNQALTANRSVLVSEVRSLQRTQGGSTRRSHYAAHQVVLVGLHHISQGHVVEKERDAAQLEAAKVSPSTRPMTTARRSPISRPAR